MKFENVKDAFNYYRGKTTNEIETRATELKAMIETDPDIDLSTLKSMKIELEGLDQAKENAQEKEQGEPTPTPEARSFNPIASMSFTGSNELREGNVYASKEYRSAFFKNLMGKELDPFEKRAMNKALDMETRAGDYSTSGNTPVVLPTSTLNEIISKARKEGGLLAKVRQMQMPTKISVGVATPSDNAVWNTEGEDVASTKPNMATVSFDSYEILKIFSISQKVKTMSIPSFENYLVEELTKCILGTIENAIVNGTGENQGTGLEKITWNEANQVTTTALSYGDIVKALGMLKRGYGDKAVFAMNNATLYNHVYSLVDGNKRPIFITDAQGDTVGKILSKEVVVDDNIGDGVIYIGNFDYYGVNMANGIAVESSTQSSFRSGKIDYRGLCVCDCKPLVDEAFIKIKIGE